MKEKALIGSKILIGMLAATSLCLSTWFYFQVVFDGTKSLKYNLFMGISLAGMIVATAYLAWLFIRRKSFSYEKLYLVLAISLGISMQIIMPCFSGPDENVHFLSAYNASNLFTGNLIDDWHFYFRAGDGEYYRYFLTFPEEYELLANGNWVGVTEEEAEIKIFDNDNIFWPRYVATGFGIFVARVFHLGLTGLMYAGRMMNTLLLVIVGYFCVKLTPVGKPQMVSLTMMPLFMEMCNSYSYDINSIMTALLLTALCLHYSEEEVEFGLKDALLVLVVLAMFIPNKIVYIVFGAMLFMIPKAKWRGLIKTYEKGTREYKLQKRFLIVAGAIFGAAVIWAGSHYVDTIFQQLFKTSGTIEQSGGVQSYTTLYMIMHPLKTLGLIGRTLINYGWSDFENVIGAYLGNHKIAFWVPKPLIWGIIVALVALLVVVRARFENEEKPTGIGKRRAIVWAVTTVLVLGAVILGSLLRFTPVDGADRVQVSYRYYLPLFASGLAVAGTRQKENKAALGCLFAQNLVYTGACCYILWHLITL